MAHSETWCLRERSPMVPQNRHSSRTWPRPQPQTPCHPNAFQKTLRTRSGEWGVISEYRVCLEKFWGWIVEWLHNHVNVFNTTGLYIQKWQILCYVYFIIYVPPKNQAGIHERSSRRHADYSFVQILQVRSLTSKDPPRAPQATESHLHTMPFVKTWPHED